MASTCAVCADYGGVNVPVGITGATFLPTTWNTQTDAWNLMDGITSAKGGNTAPGAQAPDALFNYIQVGHMLKVAACISVQA